MLRQGTSANQSSFRVHFGPIASGDESIKDLPAPAGGYSPNRRLGGAWDGCRRGKGHSLFEGPYLRSEASPTWLDLNAGQHVFLDAALSVEHRPQGL